MAYRWHHSLAAVLLGVLLIVGPAGRAVAASNALILVQPQNDQATVSITFPGVVPHQLVQERVHRLARAGGWSLSALQVNDDDVLTNLDYGPQKSLGRQTGALLTLTGAPQVRDFAFVLQPYVDAFGDLKRFEVLYILQPDPRFRGLRSYDGPALSVRLVREGGPYHYVVQTRPHSGALPRLPLVQPPAARGPVSPQGPAHPRAPSLAELLVQVAMVGAAAGLVVLIVLRLIARLQLAGSSQTESRRAIGP